MRYRDTSLLAVGKFIYTQDERFKVLHEVGSDEWFLVIRSVSYEDEGIYECQINAETDAKSTKYLLSVVGKSAYQRLYIVHVCSADDDYDGFGWWQIFRA